MAAISVARSDARRGLLLIVLTAVLWGTVGVTTKSLYQLSDANALSIGFFRLLVSTPVLLLACWLTLGRGAFRIPARDLLGMMLIGVAMAFYQVCYFAAIARVGCERGEVPARGEVGRCTEILRRWADRAATCPGRDRLLPSTR